MTQSKIPELVYPDKDKMLQCATGTKVWSRYGDRFRNIYAPAPTNEPIHKINAFVLGKRAGVAALDFEALSQRGIAIACLTALTGTIIESFGSPVGGINRTAFEMIAAATPEEYDVVVIDRAGSYYPKEYARVIGDSLLSRTVLNVTSYSSGYRLTPEEEQSICAEWENEFDITHFAGITDGQPVASVIAEVFENVPAINRVEQPDIEIVTRIGYGGTPDM